MAELLEQIHQLDRRELLALIREAAARLETLEEGDLSPEQKAQLDQVRDAYERDGNPGSVGARDFIVQEANVFDEATFSKLLETDPEGSLDYLLKVLPNARQRAGLAPLTDEQVSRAAFYED